MDKNKFTYVADKLLCALESELNDGLESVNVKEAGEVVDMIKDLYEADKYCKEAKYYKSVTDAMEENERYGYNNNRYSDGRYAPGYTRMSGNYRMGFNHMEEPYVHSYIHSPMQSNYGYVDFDNMRRYYTKDASKEDQNHYISETIQTIDEIYNSSDPTLKSRIKDNLMQLVQSMK